VETQFSRFRWIKCYYEKPSEELLRVVPEDAKSILSIGCGWGSTEACLTQRGAHVVALPLDSVIGTVAARHGIDMIYGSIDEAWEKLRGREFDAVLVTNLLHLQASPAQFLERCIRLVRAGGSLILSGPNFDRLSTWFRRALGIGCYRKLQSYDDSRISVCGPRTVRRHLESAGFQVATLQWLDHASAMDPLVRARLRFGRATANDWILRARRNESCGR
jgi:SAM-dependent methyltransferase